MKHAVGVTNYHGRERERVFVMPIFENACEAYEGRIGDGHGLRLKESLLDIFILRKQVFIQITINQIDV